MKIKDISLEYPMCQNGEILWYMVGKDGVTEIKKAERCGEMAMIPYYEIWKGDNLFAEMHHYSHIRYFTEDKDVK